jgi:hypothetical protein
MKKRPSLKLVAKMLSLFVLAYSITSCVSNDQGGDAQISISPSDEKKLKQKALRGDEDAYLELSSFYTLNLKYDEAYYVSQLVADKYQNKVAYSTLFWCLLNSSEPGNSVEMLNSLDKRTRFLCLYYLLKARELGANESELYYKKLLPEFTTVPPSNVFLDSLKSY